MDAFLKFLSLAFGVAMLAMTVRSAHGGMGAVFSLSCGAVLLLLVTQRLGQVIEAFYQLSALVPVGQEHIALILKVLGVSMLSEFAAQACRDAGEEGIALRVELGGKVMLLTLSLPLLEKIAQLIVDLTP